MNKRLIALTAAAGMSLALTGTTLAASGDPSQWGFAHAADAAHAAHAVRAERKVNEYEGQHRKVNEYEGQHRKVNEYEGQH
jgi:hypothetical protein